MSYNFTVTLHPYGDAPDRGVVKLDPAARYGYWEYKDGTEGGGLWFDSLPKGDHGYALGLDLIDFDGAYDLPKAVKAALVAAGVYLDDVMLAND